MTTDRKVKSVCRICFGTCGVEVSVDGQGRISGIRGDKQHPLSEGFICIKGAQAATHANGPQRLLRPLKRMADGSFVQIGMEQALDEIAERMRRIIDHDGPDAVAAYRGTAMAQGAVGLPMINDWLAALGSSSLYTTNTIDQAAKFMIGDAMGAWEAGKIHMYDADVMLMAGVNPLVSLSAVGFVTYHPINRMKEARARGMKLIVIDPRRTECADHADVFLQPYPGEDPVVAAGLIREILAREWEDKDFCARHVDATQLAALRDAVAPFTPELVADRAGVNAAELKRAAKLWGEGRKGLAMTGTGPSMAYRGMLSEHLYQCLNVLRGFFPRAGDRIRNPGVTAPRQQARAQVVPPTRHWEKLPPSRIRGAGLVLGEKTTGTLADEILTPGPGQVKAFFCLGGNPAATVPDREKITKALGSLDLLVAIDPLLNDTGRLAHYVLPPTVPYERPDMIFPRAFETLIIPAPFQQYVPAVTTPPAGADVMEDWRMLWELAKRLGRQIVFDGVALDMDTAPSSEDLLALLGRFGQVPFEEIKKHPGGAIFAVNQSVEAADASAGRFEVLPADVAKELKVIAQEPSAPQHHWRDGRPFTHLLASRRMRETYNSYGPQLPAIHDKLPCNPAFLNPADLLALDMETGDEAVIESARGEINAIVEADETVKRGVISMSHGWGRNPGERNDPASDGASTSALIADDRCYEPIHAQPRMSGIPVNIRPSRHHRR